MRFFDAKDVLDRSSFDPSEPTVVEAEDSISKALDVMFGKDFDQLPVKQGESFIGVITYKSVSKAVDSLEKDTDEIPVKMAIDDAKFVDEEDDIFNLLEDFAEDDFVLIGDQNQLRGILTRYDLFYFLRDQIEPFIQIGSIERNIRELIKQNIEDTESKIEQTFEARAKEDDSFRIPEGVEDFSFEDYKTFLKSNQEDFPELRKDISIILNLLESIRQERNALFHFRKTSEQLDTEQIEIGQKFFQNS